MQGIGTEISKELVRPPIKKGETITYRVLGMKVTKEGKLKMPASVYFKSIDTITDPGNGGQLVEIKCLESSTPVRTTDGSSVSHEKYIELKFERSNNGMIHLHGGNNKHQRMYQYMDICNYNKSNPNRDTSYTALFERVDAAKDSKTKLEDAAKILDAEKIALTADESVIHNLAKGFNLNPDLDISDLRLQLKAKASKHPDKFVQNMAPDAFGKIREHLSNGIEGGHLYFDDETNQWKFKKWNAGKQQGKKIVDVPIGEDRTESILKHFASKQGQENLDRLIGYINEE